MDERHKGDLFESLTKRWLQVDPVYSDLFSDVWLFGEWAEQAGISKRDLGVDLVAKERESGDLWAIQCKFYADSARIDKSNIDSFFTASGKAPFAQRMILSTTDNWSSAAEDALRNQQIPVTRIRVQDLDDSGVDWSTFSLTKETKLGLKKKYDPLDHQKTAIAAAEKYFKKADRGKLIMACGTGKTYTSLRIAESLVPAGGTVLFLVPSISLLSQTLKEWKVQTHRPIRAYAVCSDSKLGKRTSDSEDIQVTDLAYPSTTSATKLLSHFSAKHSQKNGLTVVFSTYQSIDVISKAQKEGLPEFDLIICDEAHRTTGHKLAEAEDSTFVKVHDNEVVRGLKRMYMTATPRYYAAAAKSKADEEGVETISMDDPSYGEEFYRLNFGQAVNENLLSDYKVIVLAVPEEQVKKRIQHLLAKEGDMDLGDATKIVGCYNGLRKRSLNPDDFANDPLPMRKAVAFAKNIAASKKLAKMFSDVANALVESEAEQIPLRAEVEHVDGTFNALLRNQKLDWLKDPTTENTVRVLSNAKCLSEGVDVPALDAVLFLNPRDSQVDVIQSVGRVMRKAKGKQYGYVILPIAVPAGVTPEEALNDNSRYQVVWKVLRALRSHDETLDPIIQKISMNGDAGDKIRVIDGGGLEEDYYDVSEGGVHKQASWDFDLGELQAGIFAKIVTKVGDREYWETFAQDVAGIAKDHIARITHMVAESNSGLNKEFRLFVKGLQDNLNPSVTEREAIEMLAQHLITKPVFDALFENYTFSEQNPVSLVMQRMLDALDAQNINKESERLEKLYERVRLKASGVKDAASKQTIVKDLYEKFFKLAFNDDSDRLGIVYTPNQIVDFIVKSADEISREEFGKGISDEGVHVLDPFTGTGTFIVRLLQSGLIPKEKLRQKYLYELHANEILLLAYYVAAINIEETFHELAGGEYAPFDGIVLTDTFQLAESDDNNEISGMEVFAENNERVLAQKSRDIRFIIGNPPYRFVQSSANDNNANLKYDTLDSRIDETYAVGSSASLKHSLHDSYVRAIRWSSDRIGEEGSVCFVTNNGFLDSNSADGMRKALISEFTDIYVFDLRGNSRESRIAENEGGNVFGIRVGVSIVFLIKNPKKSAAGKIHYFASADRASAPDKLAQLETFGSKKNVPWQEITPNSDGDWITHRNEAFSKFPAIGSKEKSSRSAVCFFNTYSQGLKTNRDFWVYNFSKNELRANVQRMIAFYNSEVDRFQNDKSVKNIDNLRKFALKDSTQISWDGTAEADAVRGRKFTFDELSLRSAIYRPFTRQNVYMNREMNNSVYQMPRLFPKADTENYGFYITAPGSGHTFSVLAVNSIPDMAFWGSGSGQFFPRYTFEDSSVESGQLDFMTLGEASGRFDNISDDILSLYQAKFGKSVDKDQIFSYAYGILHSDEYKTNFSGDLKRMLPRIPMVKDFKGFSTAGQKLLDLHLNYESIKPYPLHLSNGGDFDRTVTKLAYKKNGRVDDKTVLKYNGGLVISGIPIEAHQYRLGSRSAVDWVVERYQVKTDKDSQIKSDPNQFAAELGDSDYILNLIGRVVALSVETVEIVTNLPRLEIIE
jgi:predicted helicase